MSSVLLSHYPLLLSFGLSLELTGVARLADQQDLTQDLCLSPPPQSSAHLPVHTSTTWLSIWVPGIQTVVPKLVPPQPSLWPIELAFLQFCL